MWVLGAWRPLWEADLMESLAAAAGQPVSSGLFIEGGGVGTKCQPEAGDHGPGPCPSPSLDARRVGSTGCEPVLWQSGPSQPRGLCHRGKWRRRTFFGEGGASGAFSVGSTEVAVLGGRPSDRRELYCEWVPTWMLL